MFKVVIIILLKITMAALPYDDDYDESYYYSSDNIQKLLGGRKLPRELSDPARTSFFDGVATSVTQESIQAAIPATDKYTYIRVTRSSKYTPRAVERGGADDPPDVCTDEMGYRVRCPTERTTTTLRPRRRKTRTKKRTIKSRRTTTPTTTLTTTFTTEVNGTRPNVTRTNGTTVTTTNETDTTETTTKRTRRIPWVRRQTFREPNDIDRILMILDNLTYIYETDVVDRLNETLEAEGYPYCPTVTTSTPTPTTPKSWPITENTGKVIAKCFVCGMDVPGIPRGAQCADAFAPDHFPGASLIYPPTHVSRYKKHCRYLDMGPSWHINGTEGRSMWGEWTGGCAVRWVDLSGVYTQRTCRSRESPALGKNLVSKRLAKMEYALRKMDSGCIGSAQASLVPFSRGISLYARFYACVCQGTYCNGARRPTTVWCTASIVGLAMAVLR